MNDAESEICSSAIPWYLTPTIWQTKILKFDIVSIF